MLDEDGKPRYVAAGNPIKMSEVPPIDARLPPDLGADSDVILSEWLGMDHARISALRASGAV